MSARRARVAAVLLPILGVVVGWIIASLASLRPASVYAGGSSDRIGESAVVTGPVLIRYDESTKSALPLNAVYLLDYKTGRLVATVPSFRQTGTSAHVIDTFLERDLVADFKLDLSTGRNPHFMMTTGALGPFSAGWAPLYVFETTTSQLGVYRVQIQQTIGPTSRPRFDLIERRSYAKAAGPIAHE